MNSRGYRAPLPSILTDAGIAPSAEVDHASRPRGSPVTEGTASLAFSLGCRSWKRSDTKVLHVGEPILMSGFHFRMLTSLGGKLIPFSLDQSGNVLQCARSA